MNATTTTQMHQIKLETQHHLETGNSNNRIGSKLNNNQMSVANQKQQKQQNSSYMSPPTEARSPSPDGSRDYDVTRMREEDFERLAVYIVPDVQCERGVSNRADKTLPRSLTLKPSMVFSSPNVKVNFLKKKNK